MAEQTATITPTSVKSAAAPELVKGLGLFDSTMIVVGSMIGSGIYIVMAVFLEIQLVRYQPQNTWPGLIIVLIGVPVYVLWRLFSKDRAVDSV